MRFIYLFVIIMFFYIQVMAARYVIKGNQYNLYTAEKIVKSMGGKKIKKMRHKRAIVFEVKMNRAQNISMNALGLTIYKDIKHKALMACGRLKPDGPLPNPSPPKQNMNWGVERIEAYKTWSITKGRGKTACIVDTGVQAHDDLRITKLISFVDGEGPEDMNGHGTHVAGTIAALDNDFGVVGVAPEAIIISAKALDKNGSGWSSDIADAIDWCVENRADVINLSLGADEPSELIHESIKNAAYHGVHIVAAAGNNGAAVGYPAAFQECISVAATDDGNNLAGFSSRGLVSFAAPGVQINSTYLNNTYKKFDGTSMAAPHVSGVILLMKANGKVTLKAKDIGLPKEHQGQGLISAIRSVQ